MSAIVSRTRAQTSTRRARIVASLSFFVLAAMIGNIAVRTLWQWAGGPFFGSFGFVLNFGFFRIYEPWSSSFALVCCTLMIWGGCSVLRKQSGLRAGAVAGALSFFVLILSFLAAAF